jgi:hypothetical protein
MTRTLLVALFLCTILSASAFGSKQAFKKLNPCTDDTVWVIDTMIDNFAAAQPTMIRRVTILGITKEWTTTNFNDQHPTNQEWEDFVNGAYNLAAMNCGGSAGGAANIAATAVVSTFQQTVFTNVARPRMASPLKPSFQKPTAEPPVQPQVAAPAPVGVVTGAPGGDASVAPQPTPAGEQSTESGKAVALPVVQKESGTQAKLPPSNITTDLEWNLFSQSGVSGNNYALRATYSHTSSDEKTTLGASAIINTMVMLDKLFFNNAVNVSATKMIKETEHLERKVGGSLNAFIVDKRFYGTPFGMSVVASFSDNWFMNEDNILTYGAMLQQSFVGSSKTTLLSLGALFGIPIGQRYAANPSFIFAYNLYTAGKSGSITITSPVMLQPALNGSIYFTKRFTLDIGAKTTLFIKDYHDFIATVGTTVLF